MIKENHSCNLKLSCTAIWEVVPYYINTHREAKGGHLVPPIFTWYQSLKFPYGIDRSLATSFNAATPFTFIFLPPAREKLTRGNYTMWLA